MPTRLAVLGSPIAHSASPALHAAAYDVLGLDWDYGRADVTESALPAFVAGLGPEWRGLSLTMPLKRAILPVVPDRDPLVDRLGLANTVLLGAEPRLANTDVAGLAAVLVPSGPFRRGVVIGSGATAASALEALRLLGAGSRTVVARDPRRGAALPGATSAVPFDAAEQALADADAVVSTLPGTVDAPLALPARLAGTPMLDAAYDPWPTALGVRWQAAGGRLLHGLELLVEQAVLQIRLFVEGDQEAALPREDAVRRAMRAAVGR